VDGLEIDIYDTAVLLDGRVDNVYSHNIPVKPSCFTVPTALDGGYTLTPGTVYVMDLKARVLIDPSGPIQNSNTAAQSQSYYGFTPTSSGSISEIYLPAHAIVCTGTHAPIRAPPSPAPSIPATPELRRRFAI
jgi:hypothetical protein